MLCAALLLSSCTAPPPPEPAEAPAAVEQEEPLPRFWTGAFTMVEAEGARVGLRQFTLVLGGGGPNHFRATRVCYSREGRLLRRGEVWLVESGGVRADPACLSAPRGHPGFPEGLFEHRAIILSPPGPQRWIGEDGARWLYLQNPAAPPVPRS